MEVWRNNIIEDARAIGELALKSKRIAVLGIKPESKRQQPAFYVPEYMLDAGYDVVPVPTYFPEIKEILGLPVVRALETLSPTPDMVNVFRKSEDIPAHVEAMIAAKPNVVWFQLGIRNDAAAEKLAKAGIKVVQDRCLMVEHRRALHAGP
ncbi:MAG: CoA-binding protein [Clostridia bacterium]|nr:CoA-binding protein [Deltaproteobacteria bacterium]